MCVCVWPPFVYQSSSRSERFGWRKMETSASPEVCYCLICKTGRQIGATAELTRMNGRRAEWFLFSSLSVSDTCFFSICCTYCIAHSSLSIANCRRHHLMYWICSHFFFAFLSSFSFRSQSNPLLFRCLCERAGEQRIKKPVNSIIKTARRVCGFHSSHFNRFIH